MEAQRGSRVTVRDIDGLFDKGYAARAMLLLELNRPLVRQADEEDSSFIFRAIDLDDVGLAIRLLELGADPNARKMIEFKVVPPLEFAIAEGSREMCKALIDRGADPGALASIMILNDEEPNVAHISYPVMAVLLDKPGTLEVLVSSGDYSVSQLNEVADIARFTGKNGCMAMITDFMGSRGYPLHKASGDNTTPIAEFFRVLQIKEVSRFN